MKFVKEYSATEGLRGSRRDEVLDVKSWKRGQEGIFAAESY